MYFARLRYVNWFLYEYMYMEDTKNYTKREDKQISRGLVAFYDIQPGNRAGLFF